jgi:hypothetical protein
MLDESDALKFYYNNGGKLDFNNIDNGIMIKKLNLGGAHANHPKYSNQIRHKLRMIFRELKSEQLTTQEFISYFDFEIQKLIDNTRSELIDKCIKQTIKVNKLFD